jgi:hypothetical protein
MYSQNGEFNGVKWYSQYLGGRSFKLMVGSLVEMYECGYEPRFGVDGIDYANMNEIMDKMQQKIEDEEIKIDNSLVEEELFKEKEKRSAMQKIDSENKKEKNEKDYQEWLLNRDENNPLNSFMEFLYGKKDFKDATKEYIKKASLN